LETFTQLPKYFYVLIYNWNNELLLLPFYSHYTEQPELASKPNEELEDFAEAHFLASIRLMMSTTAFRSGKDACAHLNGICTTSIQMQSSRNYR